MTQENSTENHNPLSDDETGQSGEESSNGQDFRNRDSAPRPTFHQFMQLPPELRLQIWHLYCPDLDAKARVLQFMFFRCNVTPHPTLQYQTKTLRVMLSTHHESRTIALRKYPNKLVIETDSGNAIIRFRRETDVVTLLDWRPHLEYLFPDFTDEIENFAIGPMQNVDETMRMYTEDLVGTVLGLKDSVPNLKRLFSQWWPEGQVSLASYKYWCVTDNVYTYMSLTDGPENGLSFDVYTLFCWPDLDAHPTFTRSSVPRLCSDEAMAKMGVEFWPIVGFHQMEGLVLWASMRLLYLKPELATRSAHLHDDGEGSDMEYSDMLDYGTDLVDGGSEEMDDDEVNELDGSLMEEQLSEEEERAASLELEDVQVSGDPYDEPLPRLPKRKAMAVDSADEDVEVEEIGEGIEEEDDVQVIRRRISE
ncbi:hypothetical protein E4U56_003328 [Claviceps arundinis]|uniref:2EXR domain-containing protein n=1 Tax=Claviceps arundinis TaxID=1623583 RepID=A0A9P7MZT1_9HYPO|nr:hypothetical protein E4U56_003328 [Claviceps arundinis]